MCLRYIHVHYIFFIFAQFTISKLLFHYSFVHLRFCYPLKIPKLFFIVFSVNSDASMTVYSWDSLLPLIRTPPDTPLSAPPSSPQHLDDVAPAEDDDDVFKPGVDTNDTSETGSNKRRTQSLSALQNSKEPHSPLKVSQIYFAESTCYISDNTGENCSFKV